MSNILKRLSRFEARSYVFPDAGELAPEEREEQPEEPENDGPPQGPREESASAVTPIDFAKLEAEVLLRDARERADELLERARQEAGRRSEEILEAARARGEQDGYQEGQARAAREAAERRNAQAAELSAEVQAFLEQASAALEEQMDRSAADLRDLALAVAEKVVRVSLRSSGEVIGRMIQSAIDKRKRREWVHIYIADCDAKRMTQVPPTLAASLAALSNRVRIIPMADDESGTCIVEMPDEIVDASASTQLSNIRNILAGAPVEDRADLRGPLG